MVSPETPFEIRIYFLQTLTEKHLVLIWQPLRLGLSIINLFYICICTCICRVVLHCVHIYTRKKPIWHLRPWNSRLYFIYIISCYIYIILYTSNCGVFFCFCLFVCFLFFLFCLFTQIKLYYRKTIFKLWYYYDISPKTVFRYSCQGVMQ